MKTKKGHILIVDDQVNWRELLKELLIEDGHHVTTASSFGDGVRELESREFDISIFDKRLIDHYQHNVQGLTLLRLAKVMQPNIKAIMLTGYPDNQQKELALNLYGAAEYLEKVPDNNAFDIDQFSDLIFSLLNE